MLSYFPQILFLAPAGTSLLRIAAAICFAYMAWFFWKETSKLTTVEVPIVHHLKPWMIMISESVAGLVAVLLFLGAWTQIAAIVGAIMVSKQLVFFKRYRDIFPFERSTYWLLLCICLMLIVTGSGAFAFDLPL